MSALPWIALALHLFAYRMLLGFDPASQSRMTAAERLLFDTSTSSPGLIFALTALFLFARRKPLAAAAGRERAPGLAAAALVPAAALFAWARYLDLPNLLVPSLSLQMLGAALWVGGRPAFRVVLFPAAFLWLALPLSSVLVNQLAVPLQVANARISAWLLGSVGLSAAALADHVYYDRKVFAVIESCTGLRSIHTLVMAACVYVEAFGRRGRRAWLLVLLAPLVGLLINELRILSLILSPWGANASMHTLQGVVAISLGVLLLAAVDRALGWLPPPRPAPPRASPAPGAGREADWRGLVAWGAALAAASLWLPVWPAPNLSEPRLARLASSHAGWEVVARLPVDHDFLGSTRFSETLLREYARPGAEGAAPERERVKLFMGVDDRLSGGNRALSPKTRLPGSGWEVVERGQGGLPGGEWAVVRSADGLRLVYHRDAGMDRFPVELWRSALGLGRGPFRRPGRATAIRISTPMAASTEGLAAARERLDDFVADFESLLDRYVERD